MNLLAHFFRPKPTVHVVPRFHAATRAERREADEKTRMRLHELAALKSELSDEQRNAAIARAATMPLTDKQREGRA